MGTIKPVDSRAPKARAIKVTVIIAMPLIPALETPRTNDAEKAKIHEVRGISNELFLKRLSRRRVVTKVF